MDDMEFGPGGWERDDHVDSQGKEDDNANLLPGQDGKEVAEEKKETRMGKGMNKLKCWRTIWKKGSESKVHTEES